MLIQFGDLAKLLKNPNSKKQHMKKIILFTGLALTSYAATAATVVISFGNEDLARVQTINRVATSNGNGSSSQVTLTEILDTSGAISGISTTATGGQWFSQGNGGSFANSGTTIYDGSSSLVNNWASAYTDQNVGNIWQRGANGDK